MSFKVLYALLLHNDICQHQRHVSQVFVIWPYLGTKSILFWLYLGDTVYRHSENFHSIVLFKMFCALLSHKDNCHKKIVVPLRFLQRLNCDLTLSWHKGYSQCFDYVWEIQCIDIQNFFQSIVLCFMLCYRIKTSAINKNVVPLRSLQRLNCDLTLSWHKGDSQ